MRTFITVVLVTSTNRATRIVTYDETFLRVLARDEQEATEHALRYGASCETTYKNVYGETIDVTFMTVFDVNEVLQDEPENGVQELYSRSSDVDPRSPHDVA